MTGKTDSANRLRDGMVCCRLRGSASIAEMSWSVCLSVAAPVCTCPLDLQASDSLTGV